MVIFRKSEDLLSTRKSACSPRRLERGLWTGGNLRQVLSTGIFAELGATIWFLCTSRIAVTDACIAGVKRRHRISLSTCSPHSKQRPRARSGACFFLEAAPTLLLRPPPPSRNAQYKNNATGRRTASHEIITSDPGPFSYVREEYGSSRI